MPVEGSWKDDNNDINDLSIIAKNFKREGSRIRWVTYQGIPATENFVLLNQSSKSYRKTAPLTSAEQPFMSFSERELGILFWQNAALKEKLQELVLVDFEDKSIIPSKNDLSMWLQGKIPGFLIIEMLSNIGRNEPCKGPRDFKDSTPDVADLWRYVPDQIKTLGIDIGQACVLGTSALLPKNDDPGSMTTASGSKDADRHEQLLRGYNSNFRSCNLLQLRSEAEDCIPAHIQAHKMDEEQKSIVPGDGVKSISDIETKLPPLRSEGASFASHVTELGIIKGQLNEFYNGDNRFMKHKWDAKGPEMRSTNS
ncbi:hypothetical protein BC939DRAFT_499689 [Gamsiella multidivaricata]|uniref:uncharacterized protein n=1 Tax=Gamsiella multidivaricata TaxID=101098 RepID=UPI00221F3981|nr:uncharacterized protein BC939DRAFT_499689 [Gamsiella multidivaricata]KAI7830198.1 hypothetical protein BC939DRAFT_499689 [Gamsiella multidivaricata]